MMTTPAPVPVGQPVLIVPVVKLTLWQRLARWLGRNTRRLAAIAWFLCWTWLWYELGALTG